MSINQNAFAAILDQGFDVTLPTLRDKTGNTVTLRVRDLPFKTLNDIVHELVTSTREEVLSLRKEAHQLFLDVVKSKAAGETIDTSALMDQALPLLTGILVKVPDVLTRTMTDLIVDATPQVLACIPAHDMLHIMSEVMTRLDKEAVAEKLRSVFTQGSELAKMVRSKPTASTDATQ